jgi:hypothetical protein
MSNSEKLADQQRQLEELLGLSEMKPEAKPEPESRPGAEPVMEPPQTESPQAEEEPMAPPAPLQAPDLAVSEGGRQAWDRVLLARHAERPHAAD